MGASLSRRTDCHAKEDHLSRSPHGVRRRSKREAILLGRISPARASGLEGKSCLRRLRVDFLSRQRLAGKLDGAAIETFYHDAHSLRTTVNQTYMSTASVGCIAERASPGKEVEQRVSGMRVHLYDAFQDPEWFLRRIARLLLPCRANDRMPPCIRRRLSSGSFFLANEAGCHVRDSVSLVESKHVVRRILRIPEYVVVLG